MPMPEMTGNAAEQMRIYGQSGFMNIIGILEILIGASLLTNKYVGLGLTFAVAIMFNAALFHLFHAPSGIGGALVGLVLSLVLVYAYKEKFKDLFSA